MTTLYSLFKTFFSRKWLLLFIVILSITSALLEALVIYGLSQFEYLIELKDIDFIISALISLALISMLARICTLWFTNNLVLKFTSSINRQLYNLGCLKAFNARYKISESISLTEKCQIIGTSVMVPVFNAASALIIAISLILSLIYIYGNVILISLAIILIFYISVILLVKSPLWNNSQLLAKYQSNRASIISDTLSGSHEIFAYHKRDEVKKTYGINEDVFIRSASRVLFFGAVPKFIIESILIILLMLVIYVSQKSGNLITVSDLLAMGFGGIRLVPLCQQVYNGWARLRSNRKSLMEIIEFINVNDDFVNAKNIPTLSLNDSDYLFQWTSLPEHVSYHENFLNISLSPGGTTLLQGPSGSGKSTLVNSLIRCAYLKKINIGIVAPYNSRLGNRIQDYFNFFEVPIDENLYNILSKFGLTDNSNVQNFLKLQVAKLSTGEFQRLQFARDILIKPDLLIIDESFSNIDRKTVKIIMDELLLLNKTRVLLISHVDLNISNLKTTVRLK